ncbi:MAG: YlmH/Sll1252 family protein [Defluviitaleaceae bacterium]|nr:YlmH/Sll1252 family protein [Defluviitaleaceae bacterium]
MKDLSKILLGKALEQAYICEHKNKPTFTEFLDPIKTEEFKRRISKELISIKISSFGGSEGCERQIIAFSPEYMEITDDDYPIDAIEIKFSDKTSKNLTHRDFLGSILGLGIDRARVGDIVIFAERAIAFIHRDVSGFVVNNLTQVRNVSVFASIISSELIFLPLSEYEEMIINLSSMRLDGVLSCAFKISRSQVSKLIEADKALINWVLCKKSERLIKEGDMITLRGYGRVKIAQVIGQTKKDKIVLRIHVNR